MSPSGEKATLDPEDPEIVGPSRVWSREPSLTFHRRIVLSAEPDANVAPSGEKATLLTQLVCPSRVRRREPSLTRHRRIMSSQAADAHMAPTGEKATLETATV